MKKLLLLMPAAFLMACGSETETTTTPTPEPEPELTVDQQIENYLAEKNWTAERHESGIYIVTDSLGSGDERPVVTDSVTIFYQGYLLDGTQFDGTGEEPATFLLTDLIMGWQIGIPMFGKGGSGKLVIPSEYGYGDRAVGDIPANSILMFEIELVDWVTVETEPEI